MAPKKKVGDVGKAVLRRKQTVNEIEGDTAKKARILKEEQVIEKTFQLRLVVEHWYV